MPLRAWVAGVVRVVRAPVLVGGVYLITLLVTAPLGMLVQRSLPAPEIVENIDTSEPPAPDVDWLDEVAWQGSGLTRWFSPTMIGVAAPLEHVSAIIDGTLPPPGALLAIAVFFCCWTLLWGGVIERLERGSRIGTRAFAAAAARPARALLALGLIGGLGYLLVFVTVHAALFGPVFRWLTAGELERTVFVWRASLAVLFGLLLVVMSQVLDYARVEIVLRRRGVGDALREGSALVRSRPAAVVGLFLINSLCFVALIAGYGASEFVPGGSVPSLWRVLAAGQALIIGRLVLRLVLAAGQIELSRGIHGHGQLTSQRTPRDTSDVGHARETAAALPAIHHAPTASPRNQARGTPVATYGGITANAAQ